MNTTANNSPSSWRRLKMAAGSTVVRRRALRVALVVGTLLVLINQWEGLFGTASMQWGKVALTYMVPWAVVVWSAAEGGIQR